MSMNMEKISIGKKRVWPRKPYVPDDGVFTDFVGRNEELKMIAAAWMTGGCSQPLSPLLIGPPGCGKNRLVFEISKRMGLDLYVCQGYENITAEELACSLMTAEEGNGKIDYLISQLATAMHFGGICFIDEIGKFPGKALALLASVLDDRRYIDLDLIGERIHAHRNFRFIAATNDEDIEILPDFVRSRLFPVIRVEKPVPELINEMVSRQYAAQQEQTGNLLRLFWNKWEEYNPEGDFPSPRDVISVFSLASKLSDFDELAIQEQLITKSPNLHVALTQHKERGIPGEEHLIRAIRQFCEAKDDASC